MSVYRVEDWDVTEGSRQHIAHAVPAGDLIEHLVDVDGDCICGPAARPIRTAHGGIGWAYIHSSLDGREFSEGDPGAGP